MMTPCCSELQRAQAAFYLRRINEASSVPLCSCQESETIERIFLSCQLFTKQAARLSYRGHAVTLHCIGSFMGDNSADPSERKIPPSIKAGCVSALESYTHVGRYMIVFFFGN